MPFGTEFAADKGVDVQISCESSLWVVAYAADDAALPMGFQRWHCCAVAVPSDLRS